MNQTTAVIDLDDEEDDEVQKLSKELMAYENYMKLFEIPFDGQSPPPQNPSLQDGATIDLWTFDDNDVVPSPVTSSAL